MTDRDALHAAILLRPADDVPRLAFADCVQDDGEDDLAEFVRAGVVASEYRDALVIEAQEYYDALRVINRVCEAGGPAQWVADLGVGPSPLTPGDWGWNNTLDRVTVRIGKALGVFTRGTLAELTLTLGEWYAVAETALSRWPFETFTASDVPGLTLGIRAPTSESAEWRLTGSLKVPRRRVPMGGGSVVVAGLAPYPHLVDPAHEFTTDSPFATRDELLASVRRASGWIVQELEDLAGDRWPGRVRS